MSIRTWFLAGVGVWLAISAFTGIWQDQYWDRLVSPEHNIAAWNARKVVLCHVPNLVVTLTFLPEPGSIAMVGAGILALAGAARLRRRS